MSNTYNKVRELLLGYNVDEDYFRELRIEKTWTREQLIDELYDWHKEQWMTKEEAEMIVAERLEPMQTVTPEEIEEFEDMVDEAE